MLKAESRTQKKARRLIIRRTSADPIAHQFDLRVSEIGAALRHTVAGDSGAGDLAIEIRVGGIARRYALETRHLDTDHANGHGVRTAGREDHALLLSEGVMTSELRTGRREDLVLHAGEGRRRIDRLAGAGARVGRLF